MKTNALLTNLLGSLIFLAAAVTASAQTGPELEKMVESGQCVRYQGADGSTNYRCTGNMNKNGAAAASTAPTPAPAAKKPQAVKMKMDLRIDNRLVSQPQVVARLNSTATVTQKGTDQKEVVIEVTPALSRIDGADGVHMKFRIGQRDAQNKIQWFAAPEITARNQQEAELTLSTDSRAQGRREYKLKVLATLQ